MIPDAAYMRAIRRVERGPERRLIPRVQATLQSMGRALLANPTDSLSGHITKLATALERELGPMGQDVAVIEAGQVPVRKEATNLPQGWRRRFAAWVSQHALRAAQNIAATTIELFRDKLNELNAIGGISITELADEIVSFVGSRARSITIARTEVGAASSHSSEIAGQELSAESGVAYDKKWLAAADDRTRETHVAANGQIADQFGFFDIGGSKMAHPHDASQGAPLSEVINCRCVSRRIWKI